MVKKQIATFVGPNQGLSIIGTHAYGYSGIQTVTDTEQNLLDFHSGKEYISCKIQFNGIHGSPDDYVYKVYLNGNEVASYLVGAALDRAKPDIPLWIIIPPLTHVQCSAQNTSSSSGEYQAVALTGRIYNA